MSFFRSKELMQYTMRFLPLSDMQSAHLVSKDWHKAISPFLVKAQLRSQFHIPDATIFSLQSPGIVSRRLQKIFMRGKIEFLNEKILYRLYCASGSVDDDFVHLLDNDKQWFAQYFANRDIFFLQCMLSYACIMGHLDLVQFLIEKNGCQFNPLCFRYALASGELALVRYVQKKKKMIELHVNKKELWRELFHDALKSGNIELVQYMMSKNNWVPAPSECVSAVKSGRLELVKFLHEKHLFSTVYVRSDDLIHARNLALIQYMVEQVKWAPKSNEKNVALAAYETGVLNIVKYIDKKFPEREEKIILPLIYAAKSGNLETFLYCLDKFNIKPAEFMQTIKIHEAREVLKNAVLSGNVDLVKFISEVCGCKFPSNAIDERGLISRSEDLLKTATRSNNVNMVLYLINEYEYKITGYVFNDVLSWGKNLALISMLADRYQINPKIIIGHPYNTPFIIHHLIEKHYFHADETILRHAFVKYRRSSITQKDKFLPFIKYLMNVKHIKPTEEMLELMRELPYDEDAAKIIRNAQRKNVEKNSDAAKRPSKCIVC